MSAPSSLASSTPIHSSSEARRICSTATFSKWPRIATHALLSDAATAITTPGPTQPRRLTFGLLRYTKTSSPARYGTSPGWVRGLAAKALWMASRSACEKRARCAAARISMDRSMSALAFCETIKRSNGSSESIDTGRRWL
eukprot:5256731-Lingulodinium_polyedra.AAC.1